MNEVWGHVVSFFFHFVYNNCKVSHNTLMAQHYSLGIVFIWISQLPEKKQSWITIKGRYFSTLGWFYNIPNFIEMLLLVQLMQHGNGYPCPFPCIFWLKGLLTCLKCLSWQWCTSIGCQHISFLFSCTFVLSLLLIYCNCIYSLFYSCFLGL